MVGKYGGGIRLLYTSSKLTSLKNRWALISLASASPAPSRRVGSRVNSYTSSQRTFATSVVLRSRSEKAHSRAGEVRRHPEAW
jgi:hypothetical protein